MSDGSLFDLSAFGPAEPEPQDDPERVEAEAGAETTSDAQTDITPQTLVSATLGAMPVTTTQRQVAAEAPTALYRKYRPQTFDPTEHYGQEHIVNTLRNAIALDRIAHAYLFCGPRGTGKTSTARILAKAVNCEDPDPNNRPCNRCTSCIAINTGATTDVIEIDAASNRGIDDIRDLRERVKYAPTQLKTKFYIIDEAHQITGAAANAFLKTLEEPPAHTKFVLATTDPEDLLQTIVSRCQRFDFRRISVQDIVANLTHVADAEGISIDDDAKVLIARHATGSLRDAQGLLDQVAVYRENASDTTTHISADLVRTVLGVSRNDRVLEIATALANRDAAAGVNAIGEAVAAGDDVRQLTRQLLTYFRELLLAKSGGNSDLDADGKELAQRFELVELAELTSLIGNVDFKVKHATIAQLPLEIAVIQGAIRGAARPAPAQSAPPTQSEAAVSPQPTSRPAVSGGLINRVQGGQRSSSQSPQEPTPIRGPEPETAKDTDHTRQQTPPRTAESTPSASGAVSENDPVEFIRTMWGKLKADVNAVNVRTGALLSEADPVAMEGNTLLVTVPYPFHATRMNADDARLVIEQVLSRLLSKPMTVQCFTIDDFRNRPTGPASRLSAEPPVSDTIADAGETTPPVDLSDSLRAVKNIFDAEEFTPEDE